MAYTLGFQPYYRRLQTALTLPAGSVDPRSCDWGWTEYPAPGCQTPPLFLRDAGPLPIITWVWGGSVLLTGLLAYFIGKSRRK